MQFWDTSAVVPLLVRESKTEIISDLLREDPGVVVWWMTRSECVSTLARKTADGVLTPLEHAQARVRLHQLSEAWTEMEPTARLRALAEMLLQQHPLLRTADAYQLASAVQWRGSYPIGGAGFVSLDSRQRKAAKDEGFSVRP